MGLRHGIAVHERIDGSTVLLRVLCIHVHETADKPKIQPDDILRRIDKLRF